MRVMQSFGVPRATTNPYIHMLDDALAGTRGIEHLRWSRRRALLGRYDALHVHWPELLFGGSTAPRKLARRAFAIALRIRLTLTPVAVVRTMHNLAPHSDVSEWERRYLAWLDRRTDHVIVLNEHTPRDAGTAATLIAHGHYRDWFDSVPRADPAPAALGFVGLVRRYKGVEDLLDAFIATAKAAPALTLRIAGSPSDRDIEQDVRARASADARVVLDLRYLAEHEFAHVVTQCSGVVLPYRSMHNSGSVLAVLSLDRPVLVPRNEVTEALAAEVGPGWITTFDGPVSKIALLEFAATIEQLPSRAPDLSARAWDDVGQRHRAVFAEAMAHRREGAAS